MRQKQARRDRIVSVAQLGESVDSERDDLLEPQLLGQDRSDENDSPCSLLPDVVGWADTLAQASTVEDELPAPPQLDLRPCPT
ncbi:hypothetical protein BH20ACT14_BH20ACT14_10250 [soil metagenome]